MPEKGTVVMSRYELGRSLGHGTFSKVYQARSLVSGETVAVKVIDKEKALRAGAGMVDQIEREVAIMRLVGRHPNVVRLHEVMASRSKIYFVMELVRGGELLARHGSGGGGNLKVTDFGLSALSASRRHDGLLHTTCGTPSYVAPEIIGDKGYDGATADVWSCGVILFLLLAGYLPFFDSNLMEMYKKITNGEFKVPDWFTPDARSLISRLLDPNPTTRITIDELVKHPWFKKGHTKRPASSNTMKLNEEEKPANAAMNMKPASLNAFDIISLSQGFDLSGMFCCHGHSSRTQDQLFVTRKPATAIVSRLEEIAETEHFTVKKKQKKRQEEDGMAVKLQGWKEGRKGQLAIDAEIFEVSPSCYVVEVKKTAGDTLEYQAFCNRDLRPSLNDICWTSPATAASEKNQLPAVSEVSPLSSPRN
uniref:non-specific serine/threonine protein kinase n=1 Tax=Oryza barthii TaxID=65489 RepID=A0A0D3G4E2_9ORYZ